VALEVLHDTGTEPLARFLRESSLLARLSHPGIVAHVAHGVTPERVPYLAMEWLDGETLGERLAREPLTLLESLALLRGTFAALAVAHAHGVVHRDVKPSNLFLRGGRADDVVPFDLGPARVAADSQRLTRSGSVDMARPLLGRPTACVGRERELGMLELTWRPRSTKASRARCW
jgi:serine/threonine protein kinase